MIQVATFRLSRAMYIIYFPGNIIKKMTISSYGKSQYNGNVCGFGEFVGTKITRINPT